MLDSHAPYDAVILAGGRARRMGGADKPGFTVGGVTLVGRVARSVATAGQVVVVGPRRPDLPGVTNVQEDPPGCGPVPALRAGLAAIRASRARQAPWVAVLAGDLPFLHERDILELRREAIGSTGAVLVDDDGRQQWLAGLWLRAALTTALSDYSGNSMHGLLAPLSPRRVSSATRQRHPPAWYDCDTPADLDRARGWAERRAVLEEWIEAVCLELGLDRGEVDRDLVLNLARDVAHGVTRPAAPLTAYLLGLAVGRGAVAAEAATKITRLADGYGEEATGE
jgi:molybdopterin-guanine dinucleotide biosynthesis protein A